MKSLTKKIIILSSIFLYSLILFPHTRTWSQNTHNSKNILPFAELHKKVSILGTKPKNVWTYGVFTAWAPVKDGVFAAGFPKLLSYSFLQKMSAFTVSPTEVIVQMAICETAFAIPGLKEGTRFEITASNPAQVLEMIQAGSFYARLRLSSAPKILSIPKAEKLKKKEKQPKSMNGVGSTEEVFEEGEAETVQKNSNNSIEKGPLIVHFSDIGKAFKKRGIHPNDTWTYGRFSVDSPYKDGLFIAHEAGLATRRIIEGVISAGIIFPFGERYDSAIFSSRLPHLKIDKKDIIEITKDHPAEVKEIVRAGGLIVRIELADPPKVEKEGSSDGAKDFFAPLIRIFSP
ncbi:hypothetical protein A7K73_05455 [Candidatus Methylacidiphilum fumarolicum]|uniref:Uncharacterized protein n=2 Tax=Candidatus Methylacidiphilum fumarolicum TaxID=591154 RepID=I0JY99_METFB|nr:hypothetical protein [Candidatus Methylacidiphilum fumarolicum]MBW6415216.1 hypothetical protein [Candidatus Methylacidiphilum fumarolicum]TFE69819.1 hypothetical protein A7K73_05455 [Candidatus Methylacidiphilum fumarolicum]TFE76701.1 hypothetical protein A7D33_08680 [Candidatus Methylacidiphilum fumarolicum]CAI9085899.1 conserved protein of unknown function [Candidatus Methylacidiphilum fumarolicum]CCG92218.1 conserved exported hypothetical protein [Methylacidiphilum fumariolicum SolV]